MIKCLPLAMFIQVCYADPCQELDSVMGIHAGSYVKNHVCHALFWRGERGASEICSYSESSDCPTKNAVLVSEAAALLNGLSRDRPTVEVGARSVSEADSVSTDDSLMRFVVLGDIGYAKDALRATAAMVRQKMSGVTAGILLGDNFYPQGITKGIEDPQFKNVFVKIVQPSIDVPFYVVLGNHDFMGNADSQVEYSSVNSRWILPSYFHFKKFVNPDFTTCVWFLDTEHFPGRNGEQADWLVASLSSESPGCTWKIVTAHHPIFDVGEYADSSELVTHLLPILESFNVNLYMSGHEHQSQVMFNPEVSSVTFLVSGITAESRSNKQKRDHPMFVWSQPQTFAFLELTISPERIVYSFHRSMGAIDSPPMYSGAIHRN